MDWPVAAVVITTLITVAGPIFVALVRRLGSGANGYAKRSEFLTTTGKLGGKLLSIEEQQKFIRWRIDRLEKEFHDLRGRCDD